MIHRTFHKQRFALYSREEFHKLNMHVKCKPISGPLFLWDCRVPQATWEWYFKAVSQRFKGCVLVDISDDGRSRGKRNRYRVVHDVTHVAIWQPNPNYARAKSAKRKKAGYGTRQREGMDGWPGDAFGLNDVDQACTETLRRWADEGRIPRIDDNDFLFHKTKRQWQPNPMPRIAI